MSMGPWSLPNPNQQQFDAITVTYPTAVTEVYVFRKGGTTGQAAVTLTLTYTDSTKSSLESAVRT